MGIREPFFKIFWRPAQEQEPGDLCFIMEWTQAEGPKEIKAFFAITDEETRQILPLPGPCRAESSIYRLANIGHRLLIEEGIIGTEDESQVLYREALELFDWVPQRSCLRKAHIGSTRLSALKRQMLGPPYQSLFSKLKEWGKTDIEFEEHLANWFVEDYAKGQDVDRAEPTIRDIINGIAALDTSALPSGPFRDFIFRDVLNQCSSFKTGISLTTPGEFDSEGATERTFHKFWKRVLPETLRGIDKRSCRQVVLSLLIYAYEVTSICYEKACRHFSDRLFEHYGMSPCEQARFSDLHYRQPAFANLSPMVLLDPFDDEEDKKPLIAPVMSLAMRVGPPWKAGDMYRLFGGYAYLHDVILIDGRNRKRARNKFEQADDNLGDDSSTPSKQAVYNEVELQLEEIREFAKGLDDADDAKLLTMVLDQASLRTDWIAINRSFNLDDVSGKLRDRLRKTLGPRFVRDLEKRFGSKLNARLLDYLKKKFKV